MTEQKPLKTAVIGVGRMGRHHARLYHELEISTLAGVVDRDEERAATIADQYGCRFYTDVSQLLNEHPDLAAVTVATPTIAHAAVALPLLSQGISCLVEKPLAENTEEGREMVRTATAGKAVLQVGHTERFNPAFRSIREMDIKPRFIEVDRVSPMSFRSIDVGVVHDLMIHDLDIVLKLVGRPIREVRACGVAVLGEAEDVADARIEFEGGCVAKMTASRLAMKVERKLRMFSESAYITLDYAQKKGMMIQALGNLETLKKVRGQIEEGADLSDLDYTELVNMIPLTIDDEEPLKAELTNFISAVKGEHEPEVSGEDGLKALEAAEWVVDSIRRHTWDGLSGYKPH